MWAGGKTKQGSTELVDRIKGREGEKWTRRAPGFPTFLRITAHKGLITFPHGSDSYEETLDSLHLQGRELAPSNPREYASGVRALCEDVFHFAPRDEVVWKIFGKLACLIALRR